MITVPSGAVILSPADCKILYQIARLGELRTRYRVGDSAAYALLTGISSAAFNAHDAAPGTEPRQSAASEERGYWTTGTLASHTHLAPRTIRLACERGELPAIKTSGTWMIRPEDAATYVATRRQN